jgi:hypothetical protein
MKSLSRIGVVGLIALIGARLFAWLVLPWAPLAWMLMRSSLGPDGPLASYGVGNGRSAWLIIYVPPLLLALVWVYARRASRGPVR